MVEQDLVLEMAEKAQEHQDVHVYPRGWEGQDHHPQLAQDQDHHPQLAQDQDQLPLEVDQDQAQLQLEVDQDLNQRPLLVAGQDQVPMPRNGCLGILEWSLWSCV